MISTNDFRKGLRIEIDGDPFVIVDFAHQKMGRGRPRTTAKVKNMLTGAVLEKTFLSGEMFQPPDMMTRKMQYLYSDNDGFHFMDSETYEQAALSAETLGESRFFLKENDEYTLLLYNGSPISIDLPASVVLKVTEAEPAIKGDSVTNIQKTAKLETGLEVKVPLFVKEGDLVKVDTRTSEYIERA
jgi:elongation factor P